jgi:molybdopterin converting factor small subunit
LHTGHDALVEVQGGTVRELLQDLVAKYPPLQEQVLNAREQLHDALVVLVNNRRVRDLAFRLSPVDEVHLLCDAVPARPRTRDEL